jgi:hypothetical protein
MVIKKPGMARAVPGILLYGLVHKKEHIASAISFAEWYNRSKVALIFTAYNCNRNLVEA